MLWLVLMSVMGAEKVIQLCWKICVQICSAGVQEKNITGRHGSHAL